MEKLRATEADKRKDSLSPRIDRSLLNHLPAILLVVGVVCIATGCSYLEYQASIRGRSYNSLADKLAASGAILIIAGVCADAIRKGYLNHPLLFSKLVWGIVVLGLCTMTFVSAYVESAVPRPGWSYYFDDEPSPSIILRFAAWIVILATMLRGVIFLCNTESIERPRYVKYILFTLYLVFGLLFLLGMTVSFFLRFWVITGAWMNVLIYFLFVTISAYLFSRRAGEPSTPDPSQ